MAGRQETLLLEYWFFSIACILFVTEIGWVNSQAMYSVDSESAVVKCPRISLEMFNNETNSSYGIFELEETIALMNGTRVVSPCPHGNKSVGAVTITMKKLGDDVSMILSQSCKPVGGGGGGKEEENCQDSGNLRMNQGLTEKVKGLVSYCFLLAQEENATIGGKWVHEEDGLGQCREQALDVLRNELHKITQREEITALNLRQAMARLIPLKRNAYTDYASATTLVDSVSRLLETTELFEDPTSKVTRDTLFQIVEDYLQNVTITAGQKVSVTARDIAIETMVFPSQEEFMAEVYTFDNIQVPNAALEMARANGSKEPRLKVITYSNSLLYHWNKEMEWNSETSGEFDAIVGREEEKNVALLGSWRIINMELAGVKIENLSVPISYTMAFNDTPPDYQWSCVFWDVEAKNWSSSGMTSSSSENNITCESNHLTAFSVILDPLPTSGNPGGDWGFGRNDDLNPDDNMYDLRYTIHLHVLSVMSSVGSAVSMTGLALTVLTFAIFRSLRKDKSNRILLHMSISLFFLHALSLLSEAKLWQQKCLVPAMLLHYFLLTSLAWMLAEGLYMHNLLVQVFVHPQTHFMAVRSLLAWGCPLVVVGICVAADPAVYEAGRQGWCIMAGHLNYFMYYSAYLIPAALMLLINIIVFVRIMRVLAHVGKRIRSSKPKGNVGDGTIETEQGPGNAKISPTQVKGAVMVIVLLGIGWTLGFLAIGPLQIAFRYLFCLCNAGQGFFIFLFRVILQPQANRTWRRAITRGLPLDGEFTSFVSSGRKGKNGLSASPHFSAPSPSSSSAASTMTKSDLKMAMSLETNNGNMTPDTWEKNGTKDGRF